MRYPKLLILSFSLIAACSLWGQTSSTTAVVRDPSALALLSQAIAAINHEASPQLQDLTVEGTCTQWNGQTESASFTYSLIGSAASHLEIHLSTANVSWTINNGRGVSVDDKGQLHRMHFRNAVKSNWYVPATYLLQGLNDPTMSVVVQTPEQEPTSSNEDVILLTPKAPLSESSVRDYSKATSHAVHIDRSTHLVTEVDDRAALSANISAGIPHSLLYSDFREEDGWMMPHSVDEYFGQSKAHAFTFSHFTINSNLSPSNFAVSQ